MSGPASVYRSMVDTLVGSTPKGNGCRPTGGLKQHLNCGFIRSSRFQVGSPSASGGNMADKAYPPPPSGKILIFRWIDGKVRPLFVDA